MAHKGDDLELASNKLEYHVKSYVQTFQWLRHHRIQGRPPSVASNAVLDSHLLHARVLIDFLREKSRPTDVNVEDFYADDAKSAFQPLENEELDTWRGKIGSRNAHLTVKDLTELISDFKWPITDIAKELAPPLQEFFADPEASKIRDNDRHSCHSLLEQLEPMLA